jgi:hypothetical protein
MRRITKILALLIVASILPDFLLLLGLYLYYNILNPSLLSYPAPHWLLSLLLWLPASLIVSVFSSIALTTLAFFPNFDIRRKSPVASNQ